jgi:hypothetical protein
MDSADAIGRSEEPPPLDQMRFRHSLSAVSMRSSFFTPPPCAEAAAGFHDHQYADGSHMMERCCSVALSTPGV